MPSSLQQRRQIPTRDSLTTVADDGSRVFLHPADVRGRFTHWRRVAAAALIVFYASLPWIPIRGNPAVYLDLDHLRFHFFGLTLAAQDLWLGFFLITGLGFSLFYVTALFGRIWCGWACPQTVFLEHVYRRIERLLEGDAPRRRQLDRAPWTAAKWLRRGTKHVLFVVVSLMITHVLLAYFVSLPKVFAMITHAPTEHWGVFLFIIVATGVLYFNFAWFREQLCIIICPYGRLQSALIDDHSVVIGYDTERGEPRSKRQRAAVRDPRSEVSGQRSEVGDRKSETGIRDLPLPTSDVRSLTSDVRPLASALGDCIDCGRCVQVCPTGIDIRQGLQMECIGCANCIDACNAIMDKVGRPRGLIRYDSLNGLAGLRTRLVRPRTIFYTVMLALGITVASLGVRAYQPATLGITRMQGAPYFLDTRSVRNQFFVRVINKGDAAMSFTLAVKAKHHAPAGFRATGWDDPVEIAPGGEEVRPLIVVVPRANYDGRFPLEIELKSTAGGVELERDAEFIGPDPRLFREHESIDR